MGFEMLIFVAVLFSVTDGFLTEGGQQISNGHQDSTSTLLTLLVEERDLRHQLAEVVTQMKSEMDILKLNVSSLTAEKQQTQNEIQSLKHNITSLMTEKQQMQNEMQSLKHNITINQQEILTCKSQIENDLMNEKQQTQNAIQGLIHNITINQQEVLTLKNQIENDLMNEKQQTQNEIQSLKHNITSNHQEVLTIKSKVENGTQNQHVAFSAYLNSGYVYTGQPIIFNDISVNIGGGYRNGIFHCPVPGLYMFSVTLIANYTNAVYRIMKNDTLIANVYTPDSVHNYGSGSVTFLINVGFGDRIWVKSPGYYSYIYSRFSGMLIQP